MWGWERVLAWVTYTLNITTILFLSCFYNRSLVTRLSYSSMYRWFYNSINSILGLTRVFRVSSNILNLNESVQVNHSAFIKRNKEIKVWGWGRILAWVTYTLNITGCCFTIGVFRVLGSPFFQATRGWRVPGTFDFQSGKNWNSVTLKIILYNIVIIFNKNLLKIFFCRINSQILWYLFKNKNIFFTFFLLFFCIFFNPL